LSKSGESLNFAGEPPGALVSMKFVAPVECRYHWVTSAAAAGDHKTMVKRKRPSAESPFEMPAMG
jgi:hypothetical protein